MVKSLESRVPGCFDVLDEEAYRLRWLADTFFDIAERYGFAEIRTTALELADRYLSATKVHPSKIFEVRRCKERSRFVLLSDLAIGMSRFVADLPGGQVLKLAQAGRLYRDRQPAHPGYRREFDQAVLGCWGLTSRYVDAELVAVAYRFLDRIPGVRPAFVQVGNHQLFESLSPGLVQRIRFGDVGIAALADVGLDEEDRGILARLFGEDRVPLHQFAAAANRFTDPRLRNSSARISQLCETIGVLLPGVAQYVSASNLNGIGHYSGLTYQVFASMPGEHEPFGIADGGRIDQLCVTLNNVDVPAACIGVGTSILAQRMELGRPRAMVAILVADDAPVSPRLSAVQARLADAGVSCCVLPLARRRWRTVMKSPHYAGHGFVLIEGDSVAVRHVTADQRDKLAELVGGIEITPAGSRSIEETKA